MIKYLQSSLSYVSLFVFSPEYESFSNNNEEIDTNPGVSGEQTQCTPNSKM